MIFAGINRGEFVKIAGDCVGGVGGDPESSGPLPGPLEKIDRPRQGLGGMKATPHIHHFKEPPDPDRGLRKEWYKFRKRLDIEDRGAAPLTQFLKPRRYGIQIIPLIQRAPDGIEPLDPFGK